MRIWDIYINVFLTYYSLDRQRTLARRILTGSNEKRSILLKEVVTVVILFQEYGF